MKRIVLFSIVLLTAWSMKAHEFSVTIASGDTLYCNWVKDASDAITGVEITYNGHWYGAYTNTYKGDLRLPTSISYKGKSYTVTTIGEKAFNNCHTLTSINIPESILSIKDKPFENCDKLETVYYDAINCADFSSQAYAPFSADNMAWVRYEYGEDTRYPDYYRIDYALRNIIIGSTVQSVPAYMFYGMGADVGYVDYTGMKPIVVDSLYGPATITFNGVPQRIGKQCFRACSVLREIVFPEGIQSYGEGLLADCDSLYTVTLPNDMKEIPSYFFMGDDQLEHVNIPSSVTRISYEAFKDCQVLQDILLPEGLQVIGPSSFRNCSRIASLTLPQSLTTIDGYAFFQCISIDTIRIPNNVATIGNYAFQDCTHLRYVALGAQTRQLGNFVFAGCRGLSKGKLAAPRMVPTIYAQTFQGVDNTMEVEVDEDVVSLYKADTYWKRFFEKPSQLEQTGTAPTQRVQKVCRQGNILLEQDKHLYTITGGRIE